MKVLLLYFNHPVKKSSIFRHPSKGGESHDRIIDYNSNYKECNKLLLLSSNQKYRNNLDNLNFTCIKFLF